MLSTLMTPSALITPRQIICNKYQKLSWIGIFGVYYLIKSLILIYSLDLAAVHCDWILQNYSLQYSIGKLC